MFKVASNKGKLVEFLKSVMNFDNVYVLDNITEDKIEKVVIFSELDFNKGGFGCPDGMICVELKDKSKYVILIEAKSNEDYLTSCKKGSGNSKIHKQLELKMRMLYHFYSKKPYGKIEAFMGRSLDISKGGVKHIFDNYFEPMRNDPKNIFFLAVTAEKDPKINPLKGIDTKFLPGHSHKEMLQVRSTWNWQENICWTDISKLVYISELEIKD